MQKKITPYPIFIHKDPKSDYGVIVPDLPGCFSAGKTIEEAIKNAHEAVECHLGGLLVDQEPIPIKKSIDEHLKNPDFKNGILAIIEINLGKFSQKTKRIDITMPERLLQQIDKYSKEYGNNRSAFLTQITMEYISALK